MTEYKDALIRVLVEEHINNMMPYYKKTYNTPLINDITPEEMETIKGNMIQNINDFLRENLPYQIDYLLEDKESKTMTKTTIDLIKSLKPKDKILFTYKEHSANLTEEPFNTLFKNDKFIVERLEVAENSEGLKLSDIRYYYIPTHDVVYNWDHKQLIQELGFYASFLLENAKKDNLGKLLWEASCFQDGFAIDNEEQFIELVEEMERIHVNLDKYEVVRHEK